MKDIYSGSLTRLAAVDAQEMGKAYAEWNRDSEFKRLLDSDAARLHSAKAGADFFKKILDEAPAYNPFFSIRALSDNRLLGDITLEVLHAWNGRQAIVGIAIGERADWGKGYGTDAMKTLLRYAFNEMNLNRVTLNVFEYNPRAIRSYEKAGFTHEGRLRAALLRDGKRWDLLYMGVLREEWLALNSAR